MSPNSSTPSPPKSSTYSPSPPTAPRAGRNPRRARSENPRPIRQSAPSRATPSPEHPTTSCRRKPACRALSLPPWFCAPPRRRTTPTQPCKTKPNPPARPPASTPRPRREHPAPLSNARGDFPCGSNYNEVRAAAGNFSASHSAMARCSGSGADLNSRATRRMEDKSSKSRNSGR